MLTKYCKRKARETGKEIWERCLPPRLTTWVRPHMVEVENGFLQTELPSELHMSATVPCVCVLLFWGCFVCLLASNNYSSSKWVSLTCYFERKKKKKHSMSEFCFKMNCHNLFTSNSTRQVLFLCLFTLRELEKKRLQDPLGSATVLESRKKAEFMSNLWILLWKIIKVSTMKYWNNWK